MLAVLVMGTSLGMVAVMPPAASADTADYKILAGDQATNKILRFDPATSTWDDWSWSPVAAGITGTAAENFNGGNDFRVRATAEGPSQLVVVDGEGLIAKVDYETGEPLWSTSVDRADNLHSVELLPDGNVAVAATGTGYVRIFQAAGSGSTAVSAKFLLRNVHATLWDPGIRRLWVAGSPLDASGKEYQVLKALEVTGPASAPGLREDSARTQVISTSTDAVHDVAADFNDPDKLWITTNSRVQTYDKTTRQLAGGGTDIDRNAVKSISAQPSGQIIQTKADQYRVPQVICGSPVNGWCTATLDFFNPAKSVTRSGAQFYKARLESPFYGVRDHAQRGRVFDTAGGTTVKVDNNDKISRIEATAGADGRMHVLTLIQGTGMWSRTRDANGVWEESATNLDSNPQITDAALVVDGNGVQHAFTLIPDHSIWYRTRPLNGDWDGSSTRVYRGADIRSIAAVVNPTSGRLHLLMARTTGVWEQSTSAAGVWSTPTWIDKNPDIADMAAAALPDGTLHLFSVTAWGGVYHRKGTDTAWEIGASPVPLGTESPAIGQVRSLAVAGWPSTQLDLVTLRSGLGLWNQTWTTGGTWAAPVRGDAAPGSIQLYAARPGGLLHVGRISELS
ncbi:hypothetical protein SAMN04489716_1138 [Actinoplanes derwentensis]|uniref:PQQ-like domain-containing protein n=1 Tax=Actinoplanes derwentensis TaxID=113562 RepID=A0A1H1TH49_9ACTN|nr:hypothetical protein SAMN04489716_1138 [Actinoplanes derwentensis]